MKLLDSLFKIESQTAQDGAYCYTVRLDPEHFIYKAHFPGEPITPGVCILQISKELLELAVGKQLAVSVVKNVKFLRIITPTQTPVMDWNLQKISTEEDGSVKVQVSVCNGADVFAKLSIVCKEA